MIFGTIAIALLGGMIYRWRGGLTNSNGTRFLTAPKWLRLSLWAIPLSLLTVMITGNPIWGLGIGIWTYAGASLGHAKWQDLGHMDFRINAYKEDVIGLAKSGMWMAGPIGLIAKPISYMAGWYGFDKGWKDVHPWLRWGTEVGEFLTGFFIYGLFTLLLLVIT